MCAKKIRTIDQFDQVTIRVYEVTMLMWKILSIKKFIGSIVLNYYLNRQSSCQLIIKIRAKKFAKLILVGIISSNLFIQILRNIFFTLYIFRLSVINYKNEELFQIFYPFVLLKTLFMILFPVISWLLSIFKCLKTFL